MYYLYKFIYLLIVLLVSGRTLPSNVLRPRGVSLAASSLYDASSTFSCLDGSDAFNFALVNDDYCDCQDGSDEPGTSACINGSFHCNNVGHEPLNIFSSQVNDGFCDCCDTSDEYASEVDCVDTCMSLGATARAEAITKAQSQLQGFNIRKQLSEEGHRIKKEKQDQLAELEKSKEDANLAQLEKAAAKDVAEAPEKEALAKYKDVEDELQSKRDEEKKAKERDAAQAAFSILDTDEDGILTIAELRTNLVFDTNRDGEVSEDEAKFYLHGDDSMDIEAFISTGWSLVRPPYTRGRRIFSPPSPENLDEVSDESEHMEATTEEPEFADELDDFGAEEPGNSMLDEANDVMPDEADDVEEEEEDEGYEEIPEEGEEEEKPDESERIVYDEETQRLIDAATAAREEFDAADRNAKDLIRQIQDLQGSLEKDFGPNEEFRPLHGTCLEYTDREYTYKLCIFDYASQAPKDGGSETRLGTWGEWSGVEGDPYSVMMYRNGVQCWNGPQRSAEVKLMCGVETSLIAVSEPNRCEYQFIVTTPSICHEPEDGNQPYVHTEL